MWTWSVAAPAVTAAFLASLVEVVEAFTIVLAVGTLRGWKPALLGASAGLALLAALVLALGPLLGQVPLDVLQLVIGVLALERVGEIVTAKIVGKGIAHATQRVELGTAFRDQAILVRRCGTGFGHGVRSSAITAPLSAKPR